ncbi:hypothetical protein LCGC14_0432910 [marine sediment metagenome]|uniref:Uncharacterized protein n=1 Tax=marine sediment metagenome TaxID=412755 RepID=A0A0F9V9P5_9ZZZZ
MKNSDLTRILKGIADCGQLKGIKFAYGLAKNQSVITEEISTFQKIIQPKKDFLVYDAARIELCRSHTKKDKNNQLLIKNNEFVIDNKVEFDIELKKLQEIPENCKAIANFKQQEKEYNEFLTKECELSFFKIKFEDVPTDITVIQMTAIQEFIIEPVK